MTELIDITGYEGLYKVSVDGFIVSKSGRTLKKMVQSSGKYHYVALSKLGKVKNHRVHRLVAKEFIDNPENKPQVNHKDFDVFNNNVNNLEWVTVSENMKYSADSGRVVPPQPFKGKFGVDHNRSISFYIMSLDGSVSFYGSGREFSRKTGIESSCISWARNKIKVTNSEFHEFSRGKAKGFKLFINKPG